MEQVIVHKNNGSTYLLNSREYARAVISNSHKVQFENYDYIETKVRSTQKIDFSIRDYIIYANNTYRLNQLPEIIRYADGTFEYTFIFESVKYDLINVIFLLNGNSAKGDEYTGTLYNFAELISYNLNRVYPNEWQVSFGSYRTSAENSDIETLLLTGNNCLAALKTICETYKFEFVISENNGIKTITLRPENTGKIYSHLFKYGKGNGLYQIQREAINDNNIITRLYVYGADISSELDYRNDRICLPLKSKEQSFLENTNAISLYGIREGWKTYDEIKPKITGTIIALQNYYSFIDDTLPDLNELWQVVPDGDFSNKSFREYLNYMGFLDEDIATFSTEQLQTYLKQYQKQVQGKKKFGTNPQITITSGNLMGFSFNVISFDSDKKLVTLQTTTETLNGEQYVYPNPSEVTFQLQNGDTYTLSEVIIPLRYIQQSEEELLVTANKDFATLCRPTATYKIKLSPGFIRRYFNSDTDAFAVGDYLRIEDKDIGISNTAIKIESYTRDLQNPDNYELIISDVKENVSIINPKDRFRNDNDVYYKFDFGTVTSFDNEAEFNCSCSFYKNYLGDCNSLQISAGKFTWQKDGKTFDWDIAEFLYNGVGKTKYKDEDYIPIVLNFNNNNRFSNTHTGWVQQIIQNVGKTLMMNPSITGNASFELKEGCSLSQMKDSLSFGLHYKNNGGKLDYFVIGYLTSTYIDENNIKKRAIHLLQGVNFYTAYDITGGKFRNKDGDVLDLDTGKGNFKDTTITGGKFRDLNGDVVVVNLDDRKANFSDFSTDSATLRRTKIIQIDSDGREKVLYDFERGKFINLVTEKDVFVIEGNTAKFEDVTFKDNRGNDINLLEETTTQRKEVNSKLATETFTNFKNGDFKTVEDLLKDDNSVFVEVAKRLIQTETDTAKSLKDVKALQETVLSQTTALTNLKTLCGAIRNNIYALSCGATIDDPSGVCPNPRDMPILDNVAIQNNVEMLAVSDVTNPYIREQAFTTN